MGQSKIFTANQTDRMMIEVGIGRYEFSSF